MKTLLCFLDSSSVSSLLNCSLKLKNNQNISFTSFLQSLNTFHRAKISPMLVWSLRSSLMLWDDLYWISQQLGPKTVTWNTISPSYLKTMMSPFRRSCAKAKSSHPSVSFKPSIFTNQVLSDTSDLSVAILFWSFLPWRCFEKKATGMFCKQHETKVNHMNHFYHIISSEITR